MDLFPTVAEIVGLPESAMTKPIDGVSLKPLLAAEVGQRPTPIGFRYQAKRALVDNRYKLLTDNLNSENFQLYDLIDDPQESRDVSGKFPEVYSRMKRQLLDWNATVDASFAGQDYPEGRVSPPDPGRANWFETPQYQPFLNEWKDRWEFQSYLNRATKQSQKGEK
jgi:arylsulfatase A-like enzyme